MFIFKKKFVCVATRLALKELPFPTKEQHTLKQQETESVTVTIVLLYLSVSGFVDIITRSVE